MRDKIYQMLEGESDSLLGKIISILILFAILVSSVMFVLETIPELYAQYRKEFYYVEVAVVAIFTIEYVLRFITVRKRFPFIFKPLNIVDLLSVLPFYLDLIIDSSWDLRIVRIIRLIRIFRLFKLSRYSESFMVTLKAIRVAGSAFVSLIFLMMIVLVMFSTFMYFAEHDAHISYCSTIDSHGMRCDGKWIRESADSPGKPECPKCHKELTLPEGNGQIAKNFRSIVSTFWWCIVTMTTVGYGDVVPQTGLGKIIAGLTMIFGILCIALPTGVMATTFQNLYEEERKRKREKKEAKEKEESKKGKSDKEQDRDEIQRPDESRKSSREIVCPHCQKKFDLCD